MISVRMLKRWEYNLDANTVKQLPRGLVLELDEDVAVAAIADHAAEAMRPLSEGMARKVSVYKRALELEASNVPFADALEAAEAEEQEKDRAAAKKGKGRGAKDSKAA